MIKYSISDTTPMMEMKKSIEKLKIEINEMEVSIGMVSHTLMKQSIQEDKNTFIEDEDEDED